jgi:hypothetical protein
LGCDHAAMIIIGSEPTVKRPILEQKNPESAWE